MEATAGRTDFTTPFAIEPPRSTAALRDSLRKLHRETGELLDEMSDEEFVGKQGSHWSPAEHLRHLATAMRALSRGMAAPKAMLALRFGVTFKGSRTFEQVREAYRAALAAGGQAAGRFDPSARPLGLDPARERALVLRRWREATSDLDSKIAAWSEASLDRLRAKHPLLGPMTVRELLYFTLYHNAYHARRVHERRATS